MKSSNAMRLVRLRERLGLSQRELAREFRVSSGAIGFWESGGRVIPGPILKLMEAFDYHLGESASSRSEQKATELASRWTDDVLSNLPSQQLGRERRAQLRAALKRLFSRYLGDHLSPDPIQRSVQIATYSRLIREINKTKGLPLKIIQLASYLDPDMPEELRECLCLIQGAITAMPAGTAARIIYEEFGKRPAALFAEWEPKPFATASIGQVHRAKLRTGERVAVKIQYPGIREDLEAAFRDPMIQDLLFTLIRAGGGEVLEDFKARVLEECDYEQEAQNQERFRTFFEEDREIRIPKVFPAFCSARVLTTEYVEAKTFWEFAKNASQEERTWAAELVVRFQGESYFWHDTLYADIHPGNLLFLPGQLVFVDFGRVLRGNATYARLAELMMAVLENDPVRGRKAVEAAGMVREWRGFDFGELWQLLREQHCHFWEDAPFAFTKEYVSRKNKLMRSFRQKNAVHLNGPAFWNFFVVSTHDAVRAELAAKANWRGLMNRIIRAAPRKA